MPKNPEIKKVLVIGSGPIVIGQAAEFDYAGTQACRSLKEEGVEVVLANSNPATIMTDKEIAGQVYIEPLTAKVLEQIIEKEKPDSILPTLGGQAGLNLGMELAESGFLLPAFDCIPVKLLFWDGDDEFPAQANVLFDRSATDFIHIESIVTIATEMLYQMADVAELPVRGDAFYRF